ncbi:hypothetical protein [Xylocopilactobacillus apicola]|uniref:Uncharacterized protein n=1 Tax=Xylocopilactobacillus apicola TaxID=2932184 RepID=A0AAU9DTM4_9LACO|nr:hypothetical protein [Xylocopilactobacillus apicola]BDR58763.1 hypothetical protein XA3_12040 [Xylocopilactobacillus apicola]
MFSKKLLKRYAILDFILNVMISFYIMSQAFNFLPAFLLAVIYLCVGINDWRFRYPTDLVGPAIDGWLMTIGALIGFIYVSDVYPALNMWSWLAAFSAGLNLPAMLHPHRPFDFDDKS